MGADNYKSASSRLIALQNRKQQLEEAIAQKNKELRELCFKEAQITNIMPPEVPLEPGETIPQFRRKVGTAFEYPENLITKLNQEKESISNSSTQSRISALETEIQFQRCILEDASRFVNDASNVKEKHKNKLICEQTKQKIKDLEDKLDVLKHHKYGNTLPNTNTQLKQKKKPRPPFKFDIGSLKNNNNNNINYSSQNEEVITKTYAQPNFHQYETRHEHQDNERFLRNQHLDYQQNYIPNYHQKQEYRSSYTLERPMYYNSSKDRHSVVSYHNAYPHQNMGYPRQYSNTLPPNVHLQSPPNQLPQQINRYQSPIGISQPNLNYQISPQHVRTSPLRTKSMDYDPRKSYSESVHNGYQEHYYTQYNQTIERSYEQEIFSTSQNSPIYHGGDMESTGLGGYWYKNDNNESIWVPTSSPISSHWPRDKRFGSLDRRKEKYNKQLSQQQVETRKHETLIHNTLPHQPNRSNQQLVRTQSLGSVGAQTVDLWPDDNSSCESDGTSLKEKPRNRRPKPKGWCETALDGPSHPKELNPSLLEEPLYTPPSRISYSSPHQPHTPTTPKILEIPAESNPSPHQPEINVELLNNNGLIMDLPKNCTIVQAGQFKPYREVTKPFEMEDFYKYSTKFRNEKKAKEEEQYRNNEMLDNISRKSFGRDDIDGSSDADAASVVQKSIYQPLQPMKCQPYGPPK